MLFTHSKLELFVLALTVSARFSCHGHHHHHSYRHGNSRRGPKIYDYHPSSETTVIDLEQPTFFKRETEEDIYSRLDSSPTPMPEAPKETPCKGLEEGGKKYLISDAGGMLARCYGCGPSNGGYQQSVGVHGRRGDGFAQWTFEVVNGKCAIKSDIGAYAARCNGCWKGGKYPDSLFNHVTTAGPAYSLWTVEKYGDSYAFKADTGKYLARCNGCVPKGTKSDFAFVHLDSPTGPALWTMSPV